jgi:N-acetyl-anhydromuramyl-L-alanine amidase AmpD
MPRLFDTPPLEIIDLLADVRHHAGIRPLSWIEFIILHSTEGVDSRGWLSTSPESVVSIHRLIQRTPYEAARKYGGHYKILPDDKIANHVGYGTLGNYGPGKPKNLNMVSLGIELERYGTQGYTAYQYDQTAAIICEWWGLYGFLPILSHRQVDPNRRTDPVGLDFTRLYTLIYSRLRRPA